MKRQEKIERKLILMRERERSKRESEFVSERVS